MDRGSSSFQLLLAPRLITICPIVSNWLVPFIGISYKGSAFRPASLHLKLATTTFVSTSRLTPFSRFYLPKVRFESEQVILAFWTEKVRESHRVDLIRLDGFPANLAEDLETFGGRVWSWERGEDFGWSVGDLKGHYVDIRGSMDSESTRTEGMRGYSWKVRVYKTS